MDLTTDDQLGPVIRRVRESHELNVQEVAARAGISTRILMRVEAGEVAPTDSWIRRVTFAIASLMPAPSSVCEIAGCEGLHEDLRQTIGAKKKAPGRSCNSTEGQIRTNLQEGTTMSIITVQPATDNSRPPKGCATLGCDSSGMHEQNEPLWHHAMSSDGDGWNISVDRFEGQENRWAVYVVVENDDPLGTDAFAALSQAYETASAHASQLNRHPAAVTR
jgi:transcriptional regulator with XRE-family HTH domain